MYGLILISLLLVAVVASSLANAAFAWSLFRGLRTEVEYLKANASTLAADFTIIEENVAAIEAHIIVNAAATAAIKQVGELKSPFSLHAEAVGWYAEFREELCSYYQELQAAHQESGIPLKDADLFMKLSTRFSRRFIGAICLPYGLTEGEATLGACYVAKGCQPVMIYPESDH